MKLLLGGAVLLGCGLLMHLVEPVATLDCRRAPGAPPACTVTRRLFGAVTIERQDVPAAAALATEDARLGRADPDAVTCTHLAVLDPEGDATPFACVGDPAAVERARGFFAAGATERGLHLRHSEGLVVAASAALAAAGVGALLAGCYTLLRSRRMPER
jgi:hypothetical protein